MVSQQMAQSSSLAASSSAVATANLHEKVNSTYNGEHIKIGWKRAEITDLSTKEPQHNKRTPHRQLPGLHVVDDTKVVLVSADAALDLMEEIPQLHEDDQACHGQPDITKKLVREILWTEKCGSLGKRNRKRFHSYNNTRLPTAVHSVSYQHVDMVHEIQKEHSQFHDEVCVVDIGSLTLPCPWVVQIPQMDGVPEGGNTVL